MPTPLVFLEGVWRVVSLIITIHEKILQQFSQATEKELEEKEAGLSLVQNLHCRARLYLQGLTPHMERTWGTGWCGRSLQGRTNVDLGPLMKRARTRPSRSQTIYSGSLISYYSFDGHQRPS